MIIRQSSWVSRWLPISVRGSDQQPVDAVSEPHRVVFVLKYRKRKRSLQMLDKGDFQEDQAGAKHPATYVALNTRIVENHLQSTNIQLDTSSFRQSKVRLPKIPLWCESSRICMQTWFRFYSRLTSALCRACVVSPPSVSRTHCTSLAARHLLEAVGAIHLRRTLCAPGDGAEEDTDPLGRQSRSGNHTTGRVLLVAGQPPQTS